MLKIHQSAIWACPSGDGTVTDKKNPRWRYRGCHVWILKQGTIYKGQEKDRTTTWASDCD